MNTGKIGLVASFLLMTLSMYPSAGASKLDDDSDSHSVHLHDVQVTELPTGGQITPTAMPGSTFLSLLPANGTNLPAGFAQREVLSPDGNTLLVLCSGYNSVTGAPASAQTQFIFVFDVSTGEPIQKQVVPVSNSYTGIAMSPDGKHFYVPGAGEDDLHVFTLKSGVWTEPGAPIPLGHLAIPNGGQNNGISVGFWPAQPLAADVAVTADGTRAVVADRYNDSITIVDLIKQAVIAEQDLRPGKSGGKHGVPGGEYPAAITVSGDKTAYVSSTRDREVVVVNISGATPSVTARIPIQGNPNRMILTRSQDFLLVASDGEDLVTIIDTKDNKVLAAVPTLAPLGIVSEKEARYKGASPTALALSPDERTLYVANRGTNSLAVISIVDGRPTVIGLIPTGFNPSDVKLSRDGKMLYISNLKLGVVGPDLGNCYNQNPCGVPNTPVKQVLNSYVLNNIGSSLLAVPVPDQDYLRALTHQVAINNHFASRKDDFDEDDSSHRDAQTMAELRRRIDHVIYIIKENRTYDQVLGDLGKGNGDPSLTEFGAATTPNLHAIAKNFVTLDNFYTPGDVSGDGWPWSAAARETDIGEREVANSYTFNCTGGCTGSFDWWGTNRNVNVALDEAARIAAVPGTALLDEDTLPGQNNVASPDGPDGELQQGYLWNALLRAGKTVRNYGTFVDETLYTDQSPNNAEFPQIPNDRTPYADKVIQAHPADPALITRTDVYFHGFDPAYPDFYRETEWEREFKGYVQSGKLPNLTLMTLMGDHTGNFGDALDGVDTPEIEVADNDYAVARVVQAVAESPYAGSTLIFVVEDDSQDGPDHVDAHRSTAYVVGPYVKHGAVVSAHYTTVNVIRTITDVLGADHLGIFDATAVPMTDVFDLKQAKWSFTAKPSGLLAGTKLPLPVGTQFASGARPTHSREYWVAQTRQFNLAQKDAADAVGYNMVLWKGLMNDAPYRTGRARFDQAPANLKKTAMDKDDSDSRHETGSTQPLSR